jgi:hypothetical protein
MNIYELDTYGRFLDSVKTQKARASEEGNEDKEPTKAPKPGVLTRDMLTRLKRIVLGPSVTTLEQVSDRFESLLDALDDDKDDQKKGQESGPTANARTR